MTFLPLALSLSNSFTQIGALVAIAALLGVAILSLLVFSQARELKRLREWAGRAPERAADLEQRVSSAAASRVQQQAPGVQAVRPVPRAAPIHARPEGGAAPATQVAGGSPIPSGAPPLPAQPARAAGAGLVAGQPGGALAAQPAGAVTGQPFGGPPVTPGLPASPPQGSPGQPPVPGLVPSPGQSPSGGQAPPGSPPAGAPVGKPASAAAMAQTDRNSRALGQASAGPGQLAATSPGGPPIPFSPATPAPSSPGSVPPVPGAPERPAGMPPPGNSGEATVAAAAARPGSPSTASASAPGPRSPAPATAAAGASANAASAPRAPSPPRPPAPSAPPAPRRPPAPAGARRADPRGAGTAAGSAPEARAAGASASRRRGGGEREDRRGAGRSRRSPGRAGALIVLGLLVGVAVIVLVVSSLGGSSKKGAGTSSSSALTGTGAAHSTTHHRSASKSASKSSAPAPNAAEINVAVLNGTETTGLAHRVSGNLQQRGYSQASALSGRPPGANQVTTVEYASGHQGEAQVVARSLSVSQVQPMEAAVASLAGSAKVVVIVGADKATATP